MTVYDIVDMVRVLRTNRYSHRCDKGEDDGSWKWEEGYFGLNGKGGQRVLHFEDHEGLYLDGATEEQEHANARLIAAAPIMFQALEDILESSSPFSRVGMLAKGAILSAKGK